ncbi:uncharacterized protein LOC117181067 [Belonocnema kinseyi]|uniref:uncharacterized protein LOC117181067 n=1 Tax=Belonocnema kinseyi TaxID=2817044 RepID=UPI00143D68DE|nr:uncharacterized protein LOC117181067 [Belonocnema kinseyi]
MLYTSGKLLEKLIKSRLEAVIPEGEDLSLRHCGFRRGRSTIYAVQERVHIINIAQSENHYSRKVVLLATLDVKTTFDTVKWADMIESLKNFRVPEYLLRMIESYLKDIVLDCETRGTRRKVITTGATHSSILGPDL